MFRCTSPSRRSTAERFPVLIRAILLFASLLNGGVFTVNSLGARSVEQDDGTVVLELWDSVRVTDGEVTVTSDRAVIHETTQVAEFRDNVVVDHDSIRATGAFLSYSRSAGVLQMIGNAVLMDGEGTLRADRITWFRFRNKATALGSVVMTGEWLGEVTGEYALYDGDRGSLFVTSEPELRRMEGGDSLIITAVRLEFFPDEDRAEAQGSAVLRMPHRGFTATGEYLLFSGGDERMELVGTPKVEAPEGVLSGDWMEVFLREGELRSLRIEGNARGNLSRDDTARVDFSSQRALFGFITGAETEIDSLYLSGTATMNVVTEDSLRTEANTITAENLVMRFGGGEVDRVTAWGTVRGTYSWSGEARE